MKIGKLDKNTSYLLSLSGGVDSVFLFHMLLKYKHSDFECVYVNHHVNGHDDTEEAFCTSLCKTYNIILHVLHVNLETLDKGFENTARNLRYNAISKIVGKRTLLLGHHINDDVETILHNIFRGTGIKGLCGIREKCFNYGMNLYRPLVNYVTKESIIEYMNVHDLLYVEDKTNAINFTQRNFIRNAIIPILAKRFNIVNSLKSLSQKAYEAYEMQEALAKIDIKCCFIFTNEIVFDCSFYNLDVIRQKNLLYFLFKHSLNENHIDEIVKTLKNDTNFLNKIGCVFLEKTNNEFFKIKW